MRSPLCADEPDLLVIGKVGEIAGGLNGLGDRGFTDVELPAGLFDFSADVDKRVCRGSR